ncbi:CO or xanthine dehydrogenase, Mo-binding subunit [Beijerinckia sp. 28-YEA-48]|nr:CO or xanthine dehydrogenase, Mo-binding subunit [Beijerinckia sp. 28-YEA-48]
MTVVGARTRHVDWNAITSGSALYTADVSLDGELIAMVLRSPHAHAEIIDIEVTRARSLPGVHAVLTAADVTENRYLDYREPDRDRQILAAKVVRHIGEPVAIVAAATAEIAAQAINLIAVRYRPLPVLDSIEKSLARAAAAIHPHPTEKNVALGVDRSFGTASKHPSASRHFLRTAYRSSRQTHATMEPHTVKAHWRPDERCLHVWAPSQNPRLIHRDLAQLFGLAPNEVRLHEVSIGGDFGGRTQISSTEALACALSLATARPVALYQSRADEFAFTKWRLSWDIDLELGCDANGKVTDLVAKFDVDNGAYNQAGPGEMLYGSIALGASYRWHSYQVNGRCVYTNKTSASSFRGAGGYAVNWALECAVDELAEAAGIDPIDFRLTNAIAEPGETSVTGWSIKSAALRECLTTARREIGWDEKRKISGSGRGVGIACTIHVTALSRDYMLNSTCALDVESGGSIRIRSGCGDAGTGQKTLICQAVADVLDVPVEQISIVTIDTATTPHDAGAGASRGSFVSVTAARLLAEKARTELSALAAAHLDADIEDIQWTSGSARRGNHTIDLAQLVKLTGNGIYSVEAQYIGKSHGPDPQGYEDIAPTYSFAAHAVEVEVDQKTGIVKVLNVVAVHDSGTILNPISAQGQVEGGIVMGMGAVLGESLIFQDGRVVNPTYSDYVLPRASDMPNIKTIFVGEADNLGPFGAKGLGEIPLITIGPAITNAIHNAVGIRLKEAPHSPDRVLQALRTRDGAPQHAGKIAFRPERWWTAFVRQLYPRGLYQGMRWFAAHLDQRHPPSPIGTFHKPTSLSQALLLLDHTQAAAPIGGGTDILALETSGLPVPETIVDLTAINELKKIEMRSDGSLSIGAAVTLSELSTSKFFGSALVETVLQIATPQIRQSATLAGNLAQAKRCWFYRNGFDCYKRSGSSRPCYAITGDHRFYHAIQDAHRCQAVTPSDLATTLIALDAEVELRTVDTSRRVDIEKLYIGPGELGVRPGEAITSITISAKARQRVTLYRKLSLWHGGFSIMNICVSAQIDETGIASDLRIVIGSVAPTPSRERDLEKALIGRRVDAQVIDECVHRWLLRTHPLEHNHWKAFAAANVVREILSALFR